MPKRLVLEKKRLQRQQEIAARQRKQQQQQEEDEENGTQGTNPEATNLTVSTPTPTAPATKATTTTTTMTARTLRLRERSLFLSIGLIFGIALSSQMFSLNIKACSLSIRKETNPFSSTIETNETRNGQEPIGQQTDSDDGTSSTVSNEGEDEEEFDLSQRDLIAYASQGPAKSYMILKQRFERAFGSEEDGKYRFYFHSFDEDCDGCIFQYKTSLARGKNILIKAIVHAPEYHRFKYVAVFDDDAFLYHRVERVRPSPLLDRPVPLDILRRHIAGNQDQANVDLGWKTFHEHLQSDEETHPLVKPRYYHADLDDVMDTYQSCTDENFWVIRTDILHFYFPYELVHEENFWLNAGVIFVVMERCYPAGMKVLHDWISANGDDRYEKVEETYLNAQNKIDAQREYLHKRLPELEPWRLPVESIHGFHDQRCTVKLTPSQGIHPECSKYTKPIFDKWVTGEYEP